MRTCIQEFFGETLSTLKFAHRAKSIQNEARVNEDCDQKTLLRKYERELRELREEVAKRKRTLVDKRQVYLFRSTILISEICSETYSVLFQ